MCIYIHCPPGRPRSSKGTSSAGEIGLLCDLLPVSSACATASHSHNQAFCTSAGFFLALCLCACVIDSTSNTMQFQIQHKDKPDEFPRGPDEFLRVQTNFQGFTQILKGSDEFLRVSRSSLGPQTSVQWEMRPSKPVAFQVEYSRP